MKSAPPYLHRPRSSAPRLAVGASVLGALGLSGCFAELPDLPEDGIGGFSGGSGGSLPVLGGAGGSGSPGGAGGNGGSGGSESCGAGLKQCSGASECVSVTDAELGCADPSCTPCAGPAGAEMGCSEDGQCQVQGCQAGLADCNGDALGKSGAAALATDGCEHNFANFGVLSSGDEPLRIPEKTIGVDGVVTDWNGVPVYTMTAACENCSAEKDPGTAERVLSPGSTPLGGDLSAYFRVSWDSSNLYVFAEAFDDHLVQTGDYKSEDGLVLTFDGLDDRGSDPDHGNDDNRVYVGISGSHAALNRPLQGQQLVVVAQPNGPLCYRIEAQLAWRYIVGADEPQSQGKLPPAVGKTYGFDISINDWDPAPGGAEPVLNQHQHQIFWVDPGENWWRLSQGYGAVTLVDGNDPDAGSR